MVTSLCTSFIELALGAKQEPWKTRGNAPS
jgi:hypothetical protein